jgi:hypothetical protein
MADWSMVSPPLGAVKDYFGQRVGTYFAFLCTSPRRQSPVNQSPVKGQDGGNRGSMGTGKGPQRLEQRWTPGKDLVAAFARETLEVAPCARAFSAPEAPPLGHFAKWCSLSALVGVLCTFLAFFENAVLHRPRRKSRSLPLFSVFQCLWAILMLETWKRAEARLKIDWGMYGGGGATPARPEFEGEKRASMVNGRPELFFSQSSRRGRLRLSGCTNLVLVFALGAGALGAILARVYFERSLPKRVLLFGFTADASTVASVAGSIFTTLQIEIANYIYSIIAWHLNEYENHRT